jgi:hypothetical protein
VAAYGAAQVTTEKERIDPGRTDTKIVAMIRDLSGDIAYDLMTSFDIDQPTDLSDGGIREGLVAAYLGGDLPKDAVIAAWKDKSAPRDGLSAFSAAMARLARKGAGK